MMYTHLHQDNPGKWHSLKLPHRCNTFRIICIRHQEPKKYQLTAQMAGSKFSGPGSKLKGLFKRFVWSKPFSSFSPNSLLRGLCMLQLDGFQQQLLEELSSRKWSTGEFSLRTGETEKLLNSNLLVVASLAVLLWEYVITITDEARHIWR